MGAGISGSSNFDSTYNNSVSYIVAEEIPEVIATVEQKLQELDESRKRYLSATNEKQIHKDVQFKEEEFDVILKGNGEKTKALLESKFPRCSIEVVQRVTGGFSGGTGTNTYEDTYVNDALRFRCN